MKKRRVYRMETVKLLKQYELAGNKRIYDSLVDIYLLSDLGPKVNSEEENEFDRNLFKEINEMLLHKLIDSDKVLVPIPDINNVPNVMILEVDKENDGCLYRAVSTKLEGKEVIVTIKNTMEV